MEVEQPDVQAKIPGRKGLHQMSPDSLCIAGLSICGEPHDNVLILIRRKTKVGSHGRIELAERVWQRGPLENLYPLLVRQTQQGRVGFRCSVDHEHGCPCVGRNQKAARSMAYVMI